MNADLPDWLREPVYLDAVQDAAVWIETGQWAEEDVVVPEDFEDAVSRETFLSDIQDVRDHRDEPLTVDDCGNDPDDDVGEFQVGDIDWAALWQEFGFDTPDAVGSRVASKTQLQAALQASEQGIPGDSAGHISAAVEADLLQRVYADSEAGRTLRGFVLPGVNADA